MQCPERGTLRNSYTSSGGGLIRDLMGAKTERLILAFSFGGISLRALHRASLRGCGPRVDETLMTGMFMHSRAAWKAIGDQVDVSTKAKWKARCATEYHETLWKPVLDSMEPWGEFLRARTHDTVSRICIALVPFAHTGDERVPELYAMDHLAHRAGGRRGPSAGVSCV